VSPARKSAAVSLAVACLLLSACSGKSKSGEPPPANGGGPATTTVLGPTAALTGLAQNDDSVRQRPLLVVKVDNHPLARPQFGIDRADVIVEEKVEGNTSRLMALFHSEDSDRVGPVRSLRSTDVVWMKPLKGMIAYSGGIPQVKALLKPAGIEDLGADNHGVKYYKRRNDRPFEHGQYTLTPVLRELTPKDQKAPKALFEFRRTGEVLGGAGVAPVTNVQGRFGDGPVATVFDWNWNASANTWVRGTDGKAHSFENAGQISMQNVIIQFTPYRATQWRDRADSPVDEAVVVGSGDAWIFSDGKVVKGRWSRPDDASVTSYSDSAGAPVKLTPGHTWLSLIPPGQPVTAT